MGGFASWRQERVIWKFFDGLEQRDVPGMSGRAQVQLEEVIWICFSGLEPTVVLGVSALARTLLEMGIARTSVGSSKQMLLG